MRPDVHGVGSGINEWAVRRYFNHTRTTPRIVVMKPQNR